jgi:hypothetical protein
MALLAVGAVALSAEALVGSGVSPTPESTLQLQALACGQRIQNLRIELSDAVFWSNTFMITGAVLAAVGSVSAGLLNKGNQRKIAAIVGGSGAVLTVLPKALPDREAISARLAAAEKHQQLGMLVNNQLPFAKPNESLVEAQKYVSARYSHCAGPNPDPQVPPLPGRGAVNTLEPEPRPDPEPERPTPTPSVPVGPVAPSAPVVAGQAQARSTSEIALHRSSVRKPPSQPVPDFQPHYRRDEAVTGTTPAGLAALLDSMRPMPSPSAPHRGREFEPQRSPLE